MILIVYLFGAVLCGVIAGVIADMRGLTGCLFFVGAFFIGPFAILAALVVPRDSKADEREGLKRGILAHCPACREVMHAQATICPHCRTATSPRAIPPTGPEILGRWLSRTFGTGSE